MSVSDLKTTPPRELVLRSFIQLPIVATKPAPELKNVPIQPKGMTLEGKATHIDHMITAAASSA